MDSGGAGSGGTGAGGASCPPCPAGQVCWSEIASGVLVNRRCQPNPCGAEPLACTCAMTLCLRGMFCTIAAPDSVNCIGAVR
jgi:hypothetical protein